MNSIITFRTLIFVFPLFLVAHNLLSSDRKIVIPHQIVEKKVYSKIQQAQYKIVVGANGNKPTKNELFELATKYKNENENFKSVYVFFFFPKTDYTSGAYATGHSEPTTEISFVTAAIPKKWCYGDLLLWHPELAVCIEEENSESFAKNKKKAESFLASVDPISQEEYEKAVDIWTGKNFKGKYIQVIHLLEKPAQKGHYVAAENIIRLLDDTINIPALDSSQEISKTYSKKELKMNLEKWGSISFKARLKAAKTGHIESQLELVSYYKKSKDYKKCLEFIKKGMDQKVDEAYLMMGRAYLNGEFGLKKNLAKAKENLVIAKNLGSNTAESFLEDL